MKKINEFVWTTQKGERLKLHEIGDSHLLNIYKFLSKKLNDIRDLENFALSPFAPMGEIASADLEDVLDEGFEQSLHLSYTLGVLEGEIEKRKLVMPKIPYKNKWKEATEKIEYIKEPAFNGVGRLIKMRQT